MKKSQARAQRRAMDTLLSKGIGATAIGIGCLLAPMFLGASPLLGPVAAAVRPVGWVALGIGLVLMSIHFAIRRTQAGPASVAGQPSTRVEPGGLAVPLKETAAQRARADQAEAGATSPDRPSPAKSWSAAVLEAIEWRRFEAVCEALFAQAGFQTRAQSHGADGGVDIWLHSRNAEGPVAVVQCKHWLGKPVGVKEVREFFGVMSAQKLKRGTYATSGRYTNDALQFAKDNGINSLDGAGLLGLIAKRSPEQQNALLAVAYDGEYWRPTCASCGVKMVERTPAKGGAAFWGCINFPRCKTTLTMAAR